MSDPCTLYKIGALDADGRGTGVGQTAIPWCTRHDTKAFRPDGCDVTEGGELLGYCVISTGGPDHKWWEDK